MSKKPVIGITLDLAEDSDKYKYSSSPWYVLRQNYAQSITDAGGISMMIPYQPQAIGEIIALLDGLIIPGSDEDIHPKFYRQNIISEHVQVRKDDEKMNFELALLERALEQNMPFLGICHGMQLLNVSFGGDLIQHIPDYIKTEIDHRQPDTKHTVVHSINIVENSILSRLANNKHTMINSNHHQAIGNVGSGLMISATAPDNIVEAIESLNHKFVLGVQWHPEYLSTNDIDFAVFQGLVEAAKNR